MTSEKVKFQIEELPYQNAAVASVVDLFVDTPKVITNPIYNRKVDAIRQANQGSGKYVRNRDITVGEKFLENLRYIQYGNDLILNDYIELDKNALNLTIEMETGERVIIVTGCINALVSRVSGTLIKNNSCIA